LNLAYDISGHKNITKYRDVTVWILVTIANSIEIKKHKRKLKNEGEKNDNWKEIKKGN